MAEQNQRSAMRAERELHLLRFSIRCLTFCSNASARCTPFTSPCPLLSLAASSSSAASTRTSLGSLEPTIEPPLVWLLPVPKLPPTQLTRFHEPSLEFLTSQPPVLRPGDWVAERLNALALSGEEGLLFLLSTLDLTSCPPLSKSPSPCPHRLPVGTASMGIVDEAYHSLFSLLPPRRLRRSPRLKATQLQTGARRHAFSNHGVRGEVEGLQRSVVQGPRCRWIDLTDLQVLSLIGWPKDCWLPPWGNRD